MAKKKDVAAGIDWLEALEERVRAATGRLQELAAENAKLAKRVKELEKGDGGEGDWEKEREEIRGRVEKLTETLEGLLGEE